MKVFTIALAALVLLVSGCAAKSSPVVTAKRPDGVRTAGFSPSLQLFAERDVQYIGTVPHCVYRLTLEGAPDGHAVYVEASMDWCEGVPR